MDKTEKLDWEGFWKNSPNQFNDTMYQSTKYFAERYKQEFPLTNNDRVLDIGCGPGFLIQLIKDECGQIVGTDISGTYIAEAKQTFANDPKVVLKHSKPYDFYFYGSLIQKHQINKVVVLSILQYYENESKIVELVKALKAQAKLQPFSLLLADIIPTKHSAVSDIKDIVSHATKKGYVFKFFKFLFYAVFSDYRKTKKLGMLTVDPSFFVSLGKELEINIQIIQKLTLHSGRYSVLINF